jgi:DNA invertase Pin-like site-specific DNA recombinase
MSAAIYTRYSCDLQRPTSTVDQIRECRDAAEGKGWTVLGEFIRSDEATSGQSLAGRDGLDELVKLAEQPNCPFDGILIDDTSRIGRNLSDTLPLSDRLKFANVFLYFVNRRLDSRDPNFRTLFISYGQQDEMYSAGVGEKVHRGQKGQVLAGHVGSGRAYGYRNVPIESTTRKGQWGRPFVEAVEFQKIPEEVEVVIRIFTLYVGGLGHRAIARRLNEDEVPSPFQGRSPIRRVWNATNIKGILRNEKYRGVCVQRRLA